MADTSCENRKITHPPGNTQLTRRPTTSLTWLHLLALLAAIIASLVSTIAHARTTLVIKGVEGRLAENIRLLVTQPPERDSQRQFRRYIDGLPEQVITALSAYGYYSAEASISVDEIAPPARKNGAEKVAGKIGEAIKGKPENKAKAGANNSKALPEPTSITQVTVTVTPNKPVTIQELTLDVELPGENNRDFDEALANVRAQLAQGKVFVSADYESAKSTLLTRAQDLGYFDFEYTSTEVRVSRRANSAKISLQAAAGERFTFGQILFKQRTFSETFMNRWAPFTSGDPYQAQLIGELTQNLQSSGYFSSVRVRPLIDPRYEQTVPITVDLTQREENQVAIGLGYSTDTEIRTKLTWGRPLINSRGHSAEWGIEVSRYVQSASFAYRIPRDKQPLFNYWGIEYGLKNDQREEFDSFLSTLNFQRVTRTPRGWDESIFLRWERERSEPGGVPLESDLVMPGVSYSRNRSKGKPFPTWGQAINFQLMGGSESLLSSVDFLKMVGRFRYLRAISDRNTIIAAVQYGAIRSNDYERVPLSQRFFAGGDRTVRGFAFREISPRTPEPESEAVGGRYLEVLSLEYNYRFVDNWSGALFADAGRAFNRFDVGYSVGAGFGVRWQSPVGPFRLDIAAPVSDNDTGSVRVHISLGSDF